MRGESVLWALYGVGVRVEVQRGGGGGGSGRCRELGGYRFGDVRENC